MAVTAYALFADVEARAGRFAAALSIDGQRPNQADVDQLLIDCSAELDAALAARGHAAASLTADQKLAFRDLIASGALYRAFSGFPDSPKELTLVVNRSRTVWETAMGPKGSIASGSFPGLAMLNAAGGSTAGAFWQDEPAFGTAAQVESEMLSVPAELAPAFSKTQEM